MERSVKRARAEPYSPVAQSFDVFHQGITMAWFAGEARQDEQNRFGERRPAKSFIAPLDMSHNVMLDRTSELVNRQSEHLLVCEQHDLADMFAGFKPFVSTPGFGQWETGIDYRSNSLLRGQERPDFLAQAFSHHPFLRGSTRTHGRTDDPLTLVHELSEIKIRLATALDRDDREPAFDREGFEIAAQVRAADKIADDVDTLITSEPFGLGNEVRLTIIDCCLCAQLQTCLTFNFASGSRNRVRALGFCQHDCHGSDPA